jgi:hypothetical protein
MLARDLDGLADMAARLDARKMADRSARKLVLGNRGRPIAPFMTERRVDILQLLARNRYATFSGIHGFNFTHAVLASHGTGSKRHQGSACMEMPGDFLLEGMQKGPRGLPAAHLRHSVRNQV